MVRQLREKDAPLMLEWMHDTDIAVCFLKDFRTMSIDDCKEFIRKSWSDGKNMHLAVVDTDDEYMGTVSLKDINTRKGWAEFSISMRGCAMGTGMARDAMHEAIHIGKHERNLAHIYWNVLKSNARAIHFYEKNGFKKADDSELQIILGIRGGGGSKELLRQLCWYCISI